MQVARASQTIWQLAYDLCANESRAKNGVVDQMFEQLQVEQIVRIRIEAFALDSTSVKVHPDGTGALKKTDRKPSESLVADGPPRFIWLPGRLDRPQPSPP